jgi:hypothetical protein
VAFNLNTARLIAAVFLIGLLGACGGQLRDQDPPLGLDDPDDGELLQGFLVLGHEVRSFRPCGEGQGLWLIGSSPALSDLCAAYISAMSRAAPYAPLLVTVVAHRVAAPRDGFGADYAGGLVARRLVRVFPHGNCRR